MRIVTSVKEILEWEDCSLALGAFDGLHRGHMAVLDAARDYPGPWGVVTFESSPSGGPAVLMREDKLALLEKLGAAAVCSLRFSDIKDMEAEEFVEEVLFGRCHAKMLSCGEDFRFGRGRRGNVSLLRNLCEKQGAKLTVVPPVKEDGEKISSTRIRAAVEKGDIPLANRLLGREFGYTLEVIHGNHLGTGLGFPTLNQAMPDFLSLPPFGVYASLAVIDGKEYAGVTNIGVKPTVGSDRVLSETWLPEFSGDLYGRRVHLSLLEFIRPEKKFGSLEELRAEIEKNGKQAGEIVKRALQTRFPVIK